MAIFYSAIFASMRNKLANTVLYKRAQDGIIRTKPDKVKNPRTEGQRQQRTKMAFICDLARRMAPVITMGLCGKPARMTVYNEFVRRNIDAVQLDDLMQPSIELDKLICSEGILERPNLTATGLDKDIEVQKKKMPETALAADNDRVYVGAYEEDCQEAQVFDCGDRNNEEAVNITLPAHWQREKTHLYLFVTNHSHRRSSKTFLLETTAKE